MWLKEQALPRKVKDLEEKVEDRTNRQLRETLIFKNVPEASSNESWFETKDIVAKAISENVEGVTFDYDKQQIRRAHRKSNRRNDGSNQHHRRITAGFYNWDLCQSIKDSFRNKGIADRNFKLIAEQKYGPLTTWRRQKALEKRKKLKEEGVIISGYVDFPAKLMLNYPGEIKNGGKKIYRLYES